MQEQRRTDKCQWCGSLIEGRMASAKYCSEKCSRNLRTSARTRDTLSFIEVADKIIQQDFKCAGRCNVYQYPRAFTQDHWQPSSKGGASDSTNIKLLCADCNHSKGDRDGDAWLIKHQNWVKEKTYPREVAVLNFVNHYIYHYRLHTRSAWLIKGEIPPHKKEMPSAFALAGWLIKHYFEYENLSALPVAYQARF